MSKTQSSNVDGRCDGERDVSIRDQRAGTSHPDIVKEDVSLEYITMSHRYGKISTPKLESEPQKQ